MINAFGVEDHYVSKVQVPKRMVERWSDGQPRNPERVKQLKEQIKRSGRVDPLAVQIGRRGPWLANGHHRLAAAEGKTVPVKFRFGRYRAEKDPFSPYHQTPAKEA